MTSTLVRTNARNYAAATKTGQWNLFFLNMANTTVGKGKSVDADRERTGKVAPQEWADLIDALGGHSASQPTVSGQRQVLKALMADEKYAAFVGENVHDFTPAGTVNKAGELLEELASLIARFEKKFTSKHYTELRKVSLSTANNKKVAAAGRKADREEVAAEEAAANRGPAEIDAEIETLEASIATFQAKIAALRAEKDALLAAV